MLINYVPGEECRIAVVENDKLEEFYHERASSESHVSNIYKGRVTNVEPAIQAAFVEFGLERNGFLHITDLHPKYFSGKDREEFEKVGHKTARHERPPIQKCLKRGQEVLVQVLKEGIGNKGPTLTSYLSIPGRFLVMMPDMQKLGVSRKVDDDDARREMRDILKTLDPPKEFGFIVRTAGIGQTKTDLKRDLSYLQRLWKNIERQRKKIKRVGELYTESDLVIRTIRDVYNSDIKRIVCDDLAAARRARDFLSIANPRSKSEVVYYDDPVPLFDRFGIELQIENMGRREVPLPSGGALVIDQTEALVAIDVNSGKSRDARDAETNAYKTNLEAVDEIARQLRLRDLGGLVVLDLIDMRPLKNRKSVETTFRNSLKKDRARTRVGPISQFGLLEMTRQRMRPSLKTTIYRECNHCLGRGYSMSPESVVLSVMRRLALVMHRPDVTRIELTISPDVAFHILNRKRSELVELERQHDTPIMVRVGGSTVDHIHVAGFDDNDKMITDGDAATHTDLSPTTDTTFRDLEAEDLPEELASSVGEPEDDVSATQAQDDESADQARADESKEDKEDKPKRKRRRRRSRNRRNKQDNDADTEAGVDEKSSSTSAESKNDETKRADAESDPDRQANKSKLLENASSDEDAGHHEKADAKTEDREKASEDDNDKPKRRRRRRGGRGRSKSSDASNNGEADHKSNDQSDDEQHNQSDSSSKRTDEDRSKTAQSADDTPVKSQGYSNRVIGRDD
jgi:ribonuclease E